MDSFLFILRGSRIDSSVEKHKARERKTFSPFADPSDQVDVKSRFHGVDIDEVLRKAKESKDDVVVLDNYEEKVQEEKTDKKSANNNKSNEKKNVQPSPQAKNKKEKSSNKLKTA